MKVNKLALQDVTTMKLEKKTKSLLEAIKVNERETLDSVLKRLIQGDKELTTLKRGEVICSGVTGQESAIVKIIKEESTEYKVPENGRVRLTKFAGKTILVKEKI